MCDTNMIRAGSPARPTIMAFAERDQFLAGGQLRPNRFSVAVCQRRIQRCSIGRGVVSGRAAVGPANEAPQMTGLTLR